jgi:phosphodiester glycosidase
MAMCALTTASAPAALPPGPMTTLTTVSTITVRPGVTMTHYRATVRGYYYAQDVYKLAWKIGNPHVSLHSTLMGGYHAQSGAVDIKRLSSLGSPTGLVAALNGDFSGYVTSSAYANTGMLVRERRVYRFGWRGPGVGYAKAGDFKIGNPSAVPVRLRLPASTATVGVYGGLPQRADQVGVYTRAGRNVTVPTGYVAFTVDSVVFRTMLRGDRTIRNSSGLNVPEHVVAFAFEEPLAAPATASMPILGSAAAGQVVKVPATGTVLLAKDGGPAATGLAALAALATPAVTVNVDAAGWESVSDVMGGKPQLVTDGRAISTRPGYVDPWQWTCGGGCWRPALARSSNGQGWLVIAGGPQASGMTMPVFARVLRQMGARQALGFDNNGSAELYRPGTPPITAVTGYERPLPTATTLDYR